MRVQDLLLEEPADPAEIKQMKTNLLGQLRDLPNDDKTRKALIEIEEVLEGINAGGRMALIKNQLQQIKDPAVMAFQQDLAMFIITLDADPAERKKMLDYWKAGTLVNIDALLSKKKHTFGDVFQDYDTNNAIKQLVDRVMTIAALGQGKGEFGLNVLSKYVAKPAEEKAEVGGEEGGEENSEDSEKKGDLLIFFDGEWKKIECKTTHGGSARFGDQQVTPHMATFAPAAASLNEFVNSNMALYRRISGKNTLPTAGLALSYAVELGQLLPPAKKTKFFDLVNDCVKAIFFGPRMKKDVAKIVGAIQAGNTNEALDSWGQANFTYYLSQKDDFGVLNTNLNSKDFIFYNTKDDLRKQGLRFHLATPYLSSSKDPNRTVYPQIEIMPSTFGGEATTSQLKKSTFGKKNWGQSTFNQRVELVKPLAVELCRIRNVTNTKTIAKITIAMTELVQKHLKDRSPIVPELEQMFPELRVENAAPIGWKKKPAVAPVAPAAPAPAVAEALQEVDSLLLKYF